MVAGLLLGARVCQADTFYEESFSGTITSATGSLASLCPSGNCNTVSGTILVDQDQVPASGRVLLDPFFYDFSGYDIDVPVQDLFTLHFGGATFGYEDYIDGASPTFVFQNGTFAGIYLQTFGFTPDDTAAYLLSLDGLSLLASPVTGPFYETGPPEVFGTLNPTLTDITPYYPGGAVPTPEPGSLVLLGSGVLATAALMRRRTRG